MTMFATSNVLLHSKAVKGGSCCPVALLQVRIDVLSPFPMDIPSAGLLHLSGQSVKGLKAGDGATRLEGIALQQQEAQGLGLDAWELVATAVGGRVWNPTQSVVFSPPFPLTRICMPLTFDLCLLLCYVSSLSSSSSGSSAFHAHPGC